MLKLFSLLSVSIVARSGNSVAIDMAWRAYSWDFSANY